MNRTKLGFGVLAAIHLKLDGKKKKQLSDSEVSDDFAKQRPEIPIKTQNLTEHAKKIRHQLVRLIFGVEPS